MAAVQCTCHSRLPQHLFGRLSMSESCSQAEEHGARVPVDVKQLLWLSAEFVDYVPMKGWPLLLTESTTELVKSTDCGSTPRPHLMKVPIQFGGTLGWRDLEQLGKNPHLDRYINSSRTKSINTLRDTCTAHSHSIISVPLLLSAIGRRMHVKSSWPGICAHTSVASQQDRMPSGDEQISLESMQTPASAHTEGCAKLPSHVLLPSAVRTTFAMASPRLSSTSIWKSDSNATDSPSATALQMLLGVNFCVGNGVHVRNTLPLRMPTRENVGHSGQLLGGLQLYESDTGPELRPRHRKLSFEVQA